MDLLTYEKKLLKQGYKYICGIDEVGRGPLAGPVCCCAAIMDLEKIVDGVNDSKKLSEKKREKIITDIIANAIDFNVEYITNEEIDDINILNATKKCMVNAINNLKVKPDIVLIDAVKLDIDYPSISIIKGDAKSYSIAAASIIAKVSRDRLMIDYSEKYPGYAFEKNKGYGTKVHIEAIKQLGLTPIHRKTFTKKFVVNE